MIADSYGEACGRPKEETADEDAPDRVAAWNENIENFMTSIESKLQEFKAKKRGRRLSAENFGDVFLFGFIYYRVSQYPLV